MERRSDVWSCSLCQRNIMRAEVDRGRCDKDCKNPHDASVSLRTFPDYHSPMYVRGERVAIPACPAVCSSGLCVQRYLPQQLRQLGEVGGDPPRLVAGEEVRRRAPPRLLLEHAVH